MSILHTENVSLFASSYPIFIADNFSGIAEHFKQYSKIIIFTEKEIFRLHGKSLLSALGGLEDKIIVHFLKSGEKNKHLKNLKRDYNFLIRSRVDRKSVLLAFGGGVVGDYTGFVASTFLRGIDFVQIPTTLLSAVDSSVGGKVAVNSNLGKNMIGSFYQPKFVFTNLSCFATLPKKEWSSGLSEVLKHGFLEGGQFLQFLQAHSRKSISNLDFLKTIVLESVKFKRQIVEQDERETKGIRAFLNLGHTTGHAIESLTNYKKYSHGETISIGLVTCALLSQKVLGFTGFETIFKILKTYELPVALQFSPKKIWKHMQFDKKLESGKLKFVLLEDFGKPVSGVEVSEQIVLEILEQHREIKS